MPEKYREYKGYILVPGVTMPRQGIYGWDVFNTMEDYEKGKPPIYMSSSYDEAKLWIDKHLPPAPKKIGLRGRIIARIGKKVKRFKKKYEPETGEDYYGYYYEYYEEPETKFYRPEKRFLK